MCLHINADAEKQIATEDIICYKRVVSNIKTKKGKSFTGMIRGIECEGKIQVEHNCVYFCTNELALDGTSCDNLLGYRYSWSFDSNVQSIIIDGVDIICSTESFSFLTPYQLAIVKLGKTYTSALLRELDTAIEIGLHSFANYEDAKNNGSGVVVKCIIPKGAEYYEGTFDRSKSYASNRLKYVEIATK